MAVPTPDGRDLRSIIQTLWDMGDGATWENDGSNGGGGSFSYGNSYNMAVSYMNMHNAWGNFRSSGGTTHSWGFTIKFEKIALFFSKILNNQKFTKEFNVNLNWTTYDNSYNAINPYNQDDPSKEKYEFPGMIDLSKTETPFQDVVDMYRWFQHEGCKGKPKIDELVKYGTHTANGRWSELQHRSKNYARYKGVLIQFDVFFDVNNPNAYYRYIKGEYERGSSGDINWYKYNMFQPTTKNLRGQDVKFPLIIIWIPGSRKDILIDFIDHVNGDIKLW